MKKYAIVEIKGGLGNQIFQLVFGDILKDNGFKVYYNLRFFNLVTKDPFSNTKRDSVLNNLNICIDEINIIFLKSIELLNYLINSKTIKKLFPFINNKFFKFFKERDFDFDKPFAKINYFEGYWQNPKYLKSKSDFLNKILNTDSIKSNIKTNNLVMVHVRRGDYLDLGINLPITYYQKSFELLEEKIGKFNYDIFTDDKPWVSKQKLFDNSNNIIDDKKNAFDTFVDMMQYKHFIIANSTYSYLAAFTKKDNDSHVLMPNVWIDNSKDNPILNIDWLKVDFK